MNDPARPTTNGEAIPDARIEAAMDAFYPGEDWRVALGSALPDSLRDMRAAIAAADAAAETLMPAEGAGLREALETANVELCALVADPDSPDFGPACPNPADAECLTKALTAIRTALASPQPAVEGPVAAGVSVDVQTMNTSRGPDFFVRIKCGERSTTPFVFRERFKAAYEADHLAFVFGLRPDEPEIMAYDEASHPNDLATLAPPADPKPTVPGNDAGMRDHTRKAVARAMDEDGGWWKSCSGCHETNEGYETGHYPYSELFRCHVGAGCSECGGLGVVWEYYSEEDFAAMAAESLAPQTGSAGEDPKTPDAGGGFGDGRRICEALGFDPANHHNALKCPYCNPDGLKFAAPVGEDETGVREAYQYREIGEGDGWRACSQEAYASFQSDPHFDTRTVPANQPPKAETPAGAVCSDCGLLISQCNTRAEAGAAAFEALRLREGYFATIRHSPKQYFEHAFEKGYLAALSAAPAARPGDGVSVDVQTMNTSRGPDFFVRIKCGERSTTPFVFRERFKAAYEADHLAFVFGLRPDEPDLMAYDEASHPNVPAAAPAADGGRA